LTEAQKFTQPNAVFTQLRAMLEVDSNLTALTSFSQEKWSFFYEKASFFLMLS